MSHEKNFLLFISLPEPLDLRHFHHQGVFILFSGSEEEKLKLLTLHSTFMWSGSWRVFRNALLLFYPKSIHYPWLSLSNIYLTHTTQRGERDRLLLPSVFPFNFPFYILTTYTYTNYILLALFIPFTLRLLQDSMVLFLSLSKPRWLSPPHYFN